MFGLRISAACALALTMLAGCSTGTKPIAGTRDATGRPLGHGKIDDPRTKHLKCLKDKHFHAVKVGQTDLQVDSAPSGARITFAPTPGAAQELQISGTVQGAEVIGSALLYPNQTADKQLKVIEDCLAEGVFG